MSRILPRSSTLPRVIGRAGQARAAAPAQSRDLQVFPGSCAPSSCPASTGAPPPRYLRVRDGAKRHKARNIPVPARCLERVDLYVDERTFVTGRSAGRDARLFVRHDGGPLNQQFVDALLRRLCRTAGFPYPIGEVGRRNRVLAVASAQNRCLIAP
jgi:hypothetical protein